VGATSGLNLLTAANVGPAKAVEIDVGEQCLLQLDAPDLRVRGQRVKGRRREKGIQQGTYWEKVLVREI
jgi:hypothetical protein